MTGVLHQLGYLASYATEMFNGLYQVTLGGGGDEGRVHPFPLNVPHFKPRAVLCVCVFPGCNRGR